MRFSFLIFFYFTTAMVLIFSLIGIPLKFKLFRFFVILFTNNMVFSLKVFKIKNLQCMPKKIRKNSKVQVSSTSGNRERFSKSIWIINGKNMTFFVFFIFQKIWKWRFRVLILMKSYRDCSNIYPPPQFHPVNKVFLQMNFTTSRHLSNKVLSGCGGG